MTSSADHVDNAVYWPGRISALVPMVLFAWFALQIPGLAGGYPKQWVLDWVPSLDVRVVLVLDGLSNMFALIITGIGTLIVIYADAYMAGHRQIGRFHLYLHAFMLSMLGLVLSGNLMVLFVFWELTTFFSFLLIGFEHEATTSRRSARQALLVTGAGGLAFLVGIVLIGQIGGSYELQQLTADGDRLRNHSLYLPILLCILAGAFTKSAQIPSHFWLPNAMAAPTPISAFLHSATMVKAGIYLLMRMHPVLGGTMAWMATLVIVGAVTAVWGALVALGQSDLKRMLAHTTIMALGIITMLLGGTTTPTLTAAVTFLFVHALYKSALFMAAGNIDHQTGTRRIHQIGGLGKTMPFTAVATAMATLSMAGFPLFLGFIGKEIMYKGTLTEEVFPQLATTAALGANAMMVAMAATLALRPFWGRPRVKTASYEAPWPMWIGPLVLSFMGLFFGVVPDWLARWIIEPAVLSFHPTTEIIQLKRFYGINEPLLLSVMTLSLGALIYLGRRNIRSRVQGLTTNLPVSMEGLYDGLWKAIMQTAGGLTRTLQSGSLLAYLMIIITTIVLCVGWALMMSGSLPSIWRLPQLSIWLQILLLLMLMAVIVVVRSTSRLLSICALGVIGAGMAVIFLTYGAPDVALTQLLVETLTLIIAAIVLLRLPHIRRGPDRRPVRRVLSILAAAGSGLLAFAMLLAVGQHEVDRTVTAFFEQASYIQAHGRNIVNVILVDFRSLDTLGEIIVVGTSALAALALIRKGRSST